MQGTPAADQIRRGNMMVLQEQLSHAVSTNPFLPHLSLVNPMYFQTKMGRSDDACRQDTLDSRVLTFGIFRF